MSGKPGRSGGSNRTLSPQKTKEELYEIVVENPERVALPDYMQKPREERTEVSDRTILWHNRVSRMLHEMELTDKIDEILVTNFAIQLSILEDAYARYEAEGMTCCVNRVPITRVITDATVQVNNTLDKLNLLPKQRHKQKQIAQPDSEDDAFNALMNFSLGEGKPNNKH